MKRAILAVRMAPCFICADIPFSRRCLKETEQNNAKNDNLSVHVQFMNLQM